MSKAVLQFLELVQVAYAAIETASAYRHCLVCDARTKQTYQVIPGWTRWTCLVCGFVESVQEERRQKDE